MNKISSTDETLRTSCDESAQFGTWEEGTNWAKTKKRSKSDLHLPKSMLVCELWKWMGIQSTESLAIDGGITRVALEECDIGHRQGGMQRQYMYLSESSALSAK
jgi:hypothetical protein